MDKVYRILLSLVLLAAASATTLRGQLKSTPHFWGGLSAGSYAVGFKTLYQFDRTRTWRTTRGNDKPFAPDLSGRPIRISVWYPAVLNSRSRQLHFSDYVRPKGPPEFAELNRILELREKGSSSSRVPDGRWPDLLAGSVNVFAEATPASGRFPLLLYAGGLNSTSTTAVFVLAEFLASHGYVVASVPLLGPANENTEQGRMPSDRERAVQDLEFAWSVRAQANVDETQVGVRKESWRDRGVIAMRNANVSAVAVWTQPMGSRAMVHCSWTFLTMRPEKCELRFSTCAVTGTIQTFWI
jgi:hypothetical protein